MPWAPYGAKPPPAVKLPPWNEVNSSAKIVVVGISSFQIIAMVFVSASHFTPRVLTSVKNAMNSRPQRTPARVSVPVSGVDVKAGGEPGLEVAQRCLDLDRRDRHRLDQRHPPAGEAAEAAEGHERESRGAAGDRVGRAELGVYQREQSEDDRGDDPGHQRAAAAGEASRRRGLRTASRSR